MSELIIGRGDINGHAGRNIDGFQVGYGGFSNGERNLEGRIQLEICDVKILCIANTWFRKPDKKGITYGSGCNENEINFLKGYHNFFYVNMTTWKLQHNLVVVDVDEKQKRKDHGRLKVKEM